MLTLLRMLDRNRFRLHVVCPPELVEKFGSDLPSDIEAVPLALSSPVELRSCTRFARILRERDVDVVHSHMFRASLCASPIARLCRVPVTIETAHVREHWRKGWLKSKYFVDRLAGHSVDEYIAVSNAIGRYLTEEKRLPKRKVTVITNGCDLERFHPAHPIASDLRPSLGLRETDRVLLVAARLEPQKGHRVLLEALPDVLREFPNVKVLCLGDGQLRGELEERSRTLGLEGAVFFLGHRLNIPDWLALAEFTVLPSFYEGLPLAAIESLAAGRTLVATAVDGTAEVVVHEKTGLTVPAGDAPLLANAIKRLLRDTHLRKTMAVAGRQWVMEHFSQTQQVRETENVYIRALARKRHERVALQYQEVQH